MGVHSSGHKRFNDEMRQFFNRRFITFKKSSQNGWWLGDMIIKRILACLCSHLGSHDLREASRNSRENDFSCILVSFEAS